MRSYVFLSDAALHFLLQTEMTIQEIEAKLHEEIKPHYIKRIHSSAIGTYADHPSKSVEYKRSCSSASESGSSHSSDTDSDR